MVYRPIEYQTIRKNLEQYLLDNPQDAYAEAVAYSQYYLELRISYLQLQPQSDECLPPKSGTDILSQIPLEPKQVKHHLNKFPEQAHKLAIKYPQQYCTLIMEYQKLLTDHRKSYPALPPFLANTRGTE